MAKEQVWAMEPNYLQAYLEKQELSLLAIARGDIKSGIFDDDDEDDDEPDFAIDPETGIATIPIVGPLTMAGPSFWAKLFGYGGTGYNTILDDLVKCSENPAVKGVMLAINSPGGEVNGVDLVWQAIQGMSKPVVAANCGMIASAAYYIASACGGIYAQSPGDETGSIGCVISGVDDSGYQKKNGVRRINIYSKNAPNKAMSFSTDKGRELLQARVDAFERIFHSRVAEGRGISAVDVTEKFGAGGIFVASDPDKTAPNALKMGLIDGIGGATAALLRMIGSPGVNLKFDASAARPFSPITQVTETEATASEKLPATPVTKNPKPQEGRKMDLKEFMAQGPQAVAEVDALKASIRADILETNKQVTEILNKEEYGKSQALRAHGLKVMTGQVSLESFTTLVAYVDMQKEATALAAEQGSGLPETPPLALGADAIAEAKALGVDINQVRAYAKAQGFDPDKAVAAAIENARLVAADLGQTVGA